MGLIIKQSKQREKMNPQLNQNNDLYEGKTALIANRDIYFPSLELETFDQKLARISRTPLISYYPKIASSFKSSIFKKKPKYTLPLSKEELNNIDLLGNSLNEFVTQIPHEVLKQGFCATIVDYSDTLKKPYFIFVKPEQFVSFQTSSVRGYPELSQFIYVVNEEVPSIIDEFITEISKVHYVWDLFEDQVRVRKYRRIAVESDQTNYQKARNIDEHSDELESTTMMVQNGMPLESLPIIIHGKDANNFTIERSVLQDLSDLNIDIMNRSIDQVEVLHLTALPTPYITGADPNDPDIPTTIGCKKLWVLGDPDSKVGLLEFTGKAAQAHRDYIEDLKEAMAVSGAQILKKQGVSRETATSVLIRSGQETAIITSIVQNISSQIEKILKFYCQWLGKPIEDIEYDLNADFVSVDMEPNAQIALVRSWLDGAISQREMFKKFKQGELISSDKSFEEELEDIKMYPPPFPGKEKDAEIAEDLAELTSELEPNGDTSNDTNSNTIKKDKTGGEIKGSNLEIDNGTKNTQITN